MKTMQWSEAGVKKIRSAVHHFYFPRKDVCSFSILSQCACLATLHYLQCACLATLHYHSVHVSPPFIIYSVHVQPPFIITVCMSRHTSLSQCACLATLHYHSVHVSPHFIIIVCMSHHPSLSQCACLASPHLKKYALMTESKYEYEFVLCAVTASC